MKNTLNKILAVIMSVLMIAAIPMSAFATYYENPEDRKYDVYSDLPSFYPLYNREAAEPTFPIENYTLTKGNASWQQYEYTHTDRITHIYYVCEAFSYNLIVSKENPDYVYRILPDDTVAIQWNSYTGIKSAPAEMIVPSTLDGRTVTVADRFTLSLTRSVRLPNTLKSINYDPFDRTVERVFIPSSVEEICVDSIRYVDEILYAGTEEQWNNIIFYNNPDAFMGYYFEAKYSDWDWEAYSEEFPGGNWSGGEIQFNCNPDSYPAFETELSFFEKISNGFSNIIAAIIGFFRNLFSWN